LFSFSLVLIKLKKKETISESVKLILPLLFITHTESKIPSFRRLVWSFWKAFWLLETVRVSIQAENNMSIMNISRVYLITGATSGIGLEAARQVAEHDASAKIYLLCRSPEKASLVIRDLGHPNLHFLLFDACDRSSITNMMIEEDVIDGILLNAGGFGPDGTGKEKAASGATLLAEMNLIGHAALIQHLLATNKIRKGRTRIVASGSEAALGVPGPKFNWLTADFAARLRGEKYDVTAYGWCKGILALYWGAFARHTHIYVVTVSPGAVQGTDFYKARAMPWAIQQISKLVVCVYGSHSVQDGAKRYVSALLDLGEGDGGFDYPSGSFLASCKGYTQDFGDVATRHGNGGAFSNVELQDRAWEAVQSFLK
jgi:NAD(P)-dependent dehydrogenase (short-subunit alcohol dehydrogenase family)